MSKEMILILAEAPMLDRVGQWASRNELKISPLPVMRPGIPLSLEVIDDSCANLVYDLPHKTVVKDGNVIGYWSVSTVASEQEGRTVKIIEPMGYR